MEKSALLYEGKAKRVYATTNPELVWVEYKDSATAFDGQKKATISGKGVLNNRITSLIFTKLEEAGIPSHFIQQLSDTEQLVKKVSIVPLEVVVRNYSAGSFSKRVGMAEGVKLPRPLVEFYYKSDALGDPLLTEDHIEVLGLASKEDVANLKAQALRVNEVLGKLMAEVGVILVDFKLEFGRDGEGHILLADEISPDTCRFWDAETKQKLDKDVFRRDLGSLTEAYAIILNKLEG